MLRRFLQYLFGEQLAGRDPRWPHARAEHLKRQPACVVTGETEDVEVHHLIPVHIDASKELDPDNMRTVTRPIHYLFGHLLDWKAWNPNFDADVSWIRDKIKARRYGR